MSSHSNTLQGKRVLIVGGGGGGNGRAITRAVGAAGAAVAVVDVEKERGDEAAAELVETGCTAVGVAADVALVNDVDRMVATSVDELGGIDALITVVGGHGLFAPWVPLHETTDEDWDRIVDMNLRYVFRVSRAVLKVFLDQGQGGSIVSVGSLAGVVSSPMSGAYGAAKAGLINLARSVSLEYARHGIRMNTLSCGLILTPAARHSLPDPTIMERRVPLGRAGEPAEVADAVVFLASPISSYISGQNLNIDGGASVHFPLPLPKSETFMAG